MTSMAEAAKVAASRDCRGVSFGNRISKQPESAQLSKTSDAGGDIVRVDPKEEAQRVHHLGCLRMSLLIRLYLLP
jgi:hypothetical protein